MTKLQSVEYSARRFGLGQLSLSDYTGDVKVVRSVLDRNKCPMWFKGHSKAMGPQDDQFWYALDGQGNMTVVDQTAKVAK